MPEDVELSVYGRDKAEFMMPELVRGVARKIEADVIINAAAYTAVDRAETEVSVAETINGHSVAALASAAAETGTPLVHVSTDYVFDGSGDTPHSPDEPTAPSTPGNSASCSPPSVSWPTSVGPVRMPWLRGRTVRRSLPSFGVSPPQAVRKSCLRSPPLRFEESWAITN